MGWRLAMALLVLEEPRCSRSSSRLVTKSVTSLLAHGVVVCSLTEMGLIRTLPRSPEVLEVYGNKLVPTVAHSTCSYLLKKFTIVSHEKYYLLGI